MRFPSFLLLALFIVVTPPSISARHIPATEEAVPDGTAYQVCAAAAPQVGESAESLYTQYQSGRITITELGAVPNGRRYAIARDQDFVIIIDVTGV